MAVQTLQLICDQSTYANYFQWASAVDKWFATNTWIQSTDTGQWMRSGMNITAVAGISGSSATYTYNSLTGVALQIGQALTITAMTHSINSGTFVITALGGGTFTIANQNGTPLAESGSTGVVTQASTVPGTSLFYNSIWQPNDLLTNFYAKMEYGNFSGQANAPTIQISIGTGSDGAGNLTGTVMGPFLIPMTNPNPYSTSIPWECRFTASSSRIAVMLWRLETNYCTQLFSIERSVNSSGVYTGSYVTLITVGDTGSTTSYQSSSQHSLVFGVGVPPAQCPISPSNGTGGLAIRVVNAGNYPNTLFNNMIPFELAAPFIGAYDYPQTNIGMIPYPNGQEGMIFSATVYGTGHTYIMTRAGSMGCISYGPIVNYLCMRYD
jgi:hypothetical protein